MNKRLIALLLSFVCIQQTYAQKDTAMHTTPDTLKALPEVTVRAYEQYQNILTLPAAVGVIDKNDLNAYSNNNILQAVNTILGVRMEERSPGSYRFGIRGSALESPFGVRNIKVYYNGIPYTDPSGNTYLNQIGFYNISSLEVIKGPGSSLYGTGTGGVLLLNSIPDQWQPGATMHYTGGSYGLSNTAAEARIGDDKFKNVIRYQHMTSDGYREQSAMRNDVLSWDAVMKQNEKSELSVHALYGDLYYQTPGGLTLKEYMANPADARPATTTTPSAMEAQAAIHQQSFLSGFTYKHKLSERWTNSTTLYGSYTRQLNPNTRNYSRTSEPNAGGRTLLTYNATHNETNYQWITGGELQQEIAQNRTYANINGTPKNLHSDQEINNGQAMGFTQLSVQTGKWVFTGGISINRLHVALTTLSGMTPSDQSKIFSNELAPRIAVLNRLTENTSVYAAVEKGFSPPTIDELAPTGSLTNFNLNAEQGWNYEAGLRGYTLNSKLYYDVNVFYFQLQNTIVQRRDSAGGDYYLNAGGTKQTGAEVFLRYRLTNTNSLVNSFVRLGYCSYNFKYDKFVQVTNDYSGKMLPGTPANTLTAGATLAIPFGLYWNVDYYFCDRISLNDANTAYADQYHLLSTKLGYKRTMRKYSFDVFAGINNIMNQQYSLGNDINAVNGRYYNAAAPVNYYAGVSLGYLR